MEMRFVSKMQKDRKERTKASRSRVITPYNANISLRYPEITGGISEGLVSVVLCNFVSSVQIQRVNTDLD